MQVTVKQRDAGAYFADENTSGSTENITLTNGVQEVTCEGVLIFEEEDLEETFDDWLQCAEDGEDGYTVVAVA